MKIYGNDGKVLFGDKIVEILSQNANLIEVKLNNDEICLVEVTGSNGNDVIANVIKSSNPDEVTIGGLKYKTVKIGSQVWLAENLQLATANSVFYNNDEATYGRNGKNYGRLYEWDDVKALVIPGWHLPTVNEYKQLINAIGYSTSTTSCDGANELRSSSGWTTNNGIDSYGFSLKPSGGGSRVAGTFGGDGTGAYIWTADENPSNTSEAYAITSTSANYKITIPASTAKNLLRAVRLVKN